VYTREQKKARLAEYAEHLIEEMLDWTEKAERPNLTEIEDEVLELRARFGVELARESIEAQEMRRPVPGPRCPQCGAEMDYKGQKEVTPHTWLGEVRYERGYYYCKPCKVGFFPSG
jgi:DNA repair exonuclease SbcCD ATPase subunit